MSTTYNLIIYMDERLLDSHELANLLFARQVNGNINVIFQSKTGNEFSNFNQLQWEENYMIAATKTLVDGDLVTVGTKKRTINANWVCDWTVPVGQPELQEMPPAKPVQPAWGWKPVGSFGTRNIPDEWYDTIWCSTADGNFNCIYADQTVYPGLGNRSYLVDNIFQLSWSEENKVGSVLNTQWSNSWLLEYDVGETTKWVSWGYGTGAKTPTWFLYSADPGDHNPSSPYVTINPLEPGGSALTAPKAGFSHPVLIEYSFASNPYLNQAGVERDAAAFADYLQSATPSNLNLQVTSNSGSVSVLASLDLNAPSSDLIIGSSSDEKVLSVIQGLTDPVAPRYRPLSTSINIDPVVPADTTTSGAGVGVTKKYRNFKGKLEWKTSAPGTPDWKAISNDLGGKLPNGYTLSGYTANERSCDFPFTSANAVAKDVADTTFNDVYTKLTQYANLANEGITVVGSLAAAAGAAVHGAPGAGSKHYHPRHRHHNGYGVTANGANGAY